MAIEEFKLAYLKNHVNISRLPKSSMRKTEAKTWSEWCTLGLPGEVYICIFLFLFFIIISGDWQTPVWTTDATSHKSHISLPKGCTHTVRNYSTNRPIGILKPNDYICSHNSFRLLIMRSEWFHAIFQISIFSANPRCLHCPAHALLRFLVILALAFFCISRVRWCPVNSRYS